MSGIVNSTGAVSGIIGTTVGTPSTAPIAGQMRHLANTSTANITDVLVSTNLHSTLLTGTFTAGSRILLHFQMIGFHQPATSVTAGYGQFYASGISSSTGTASHSGIASTTTGAQIVQEIGYYHNIVSSQVGPFCELLVTPTNGATEATYNIYYDESADQTLHFYQMQLSLWEVF